MAETSSNTEFRAIDDNPSQTPCSESGESYLADKHAKAQQERGASALKWWILLDVFVAWNSSWFTTFSAASLETTLIETLHWSSSQYSYVTASTFCGAIVGPFLLPMFDWILSLAALENIPLGSNHFSQLLLILGQGSFAALLPHTRDSDGFYTLILLSRFVIGLGMGSADAKCQGTISYWFGASDRVNEAFGLLIIGIEIGMLTSRVAFPPFYELFNAGNGPSDLPLPFILALLIPMGSVLVSLAIELKVQSAKSAFPQYFVDPDEVDGGADVNASNESSIARRCGSIVRGFANFSPTVWLVVTIVVLVNALITVIYSCFVDPLHEAFALSEYDADLVLSLSAIAVVSMQFPASWIMDYVGGAAYWIWLYATTLSMGMLILSVTAYLPLYDNIGINEYHMRVFGVVGIVLFSILLPFENIYGLQAIASPPQYAQLIASTTTVLFWTLSIVVVNGFGWIRDATGDYSIALLLVFCLSALTWLLTGALVVKDRRAEGPMTKLTDAARREDILSSLCPPSDAHNLLPSDVSSTTDGEELQPLLNETANANEFQ